MKWWKIDYFRLEQRSLNKFLMTKKNTPREIDRIMCVENSVLVFDIFRIGQTWVSHYELESKRQSIKPKHSDAPVKKKFPRAVVIKEGNADNLFRPGKVLSLLISLTIVNRASYYQLLKQNSPY